jgi:bifunctional non-homologous end joining protein LigD
MAQRPRPDLDTLLRYTEKRNFALTPEPKGARGGNARSLSFVIQKHWASRLHYDFRLELDGVLLSWAVPKGPSFDPQDKRMAIKVEDHPVAYGNFEGTIPPKQYGAGTVIVWDRGSWAPVGDAHEGLANGKLVFELHGEKLAGRWELVRIRKPQDKQDPWILFKKRDAWARPAAEYDVIVALPDSVIHKPLGLVEQREVRGNVEAAAPSEDPVSPAELPGAVQSELPRTLAPQLAIAAERVPERGQWRCEIKFDGYRLLARIERGKARLLTRNGNDWTSKMKPLATAVEALGVRSGWLDGEIVVLGADGKPDFSALQNALDAPGSDAIEYFLFDLPFFEGQDLRQVPLHARRSLLKQLLDAKAIDGLRFSADFAADPASVLESARALGLEGIVAKRIDAPYVSQRASSWLKLKCNGRQEFVIAGFIDRAGSNAEVGSLLLGYHDNSGELQYAGNVGTGWTSASAAALRKQLLKIETKASPFRSGAVKPGRWSRRATGTERWVEPTLVAEIRFAGWTPDGHIRHAVYEGLRADKPASEVTRDAIGNPAHDKATAAPRAAAKTAPTAGASPVKLTHPERIIDPSSGLKKLDLARYYDSVAERILPHLKGRPVSLVRGPEGITGTLFFQKHMDPVSIPGLRELDAALWPGHAALLEVPSRQALLNAAQMNVIEFHTWNSTAKAIDKPDRMVFDLDPGEGVAWSRVQEAALLMQTLLGELGLAGWLKTSGGKGLHVVVPLAPRLSADTVKDFSRAIVQHLARTIPSRFVAKSGPANRVGKIFVDYLRNTHGATTACAFSARARPGLGVSMPVSWEQLPALKGGGQWTVANAREYLSFEQTDPWAAYWKTRQSLGGAMKALGYAPPKVAG